MKALFLQLCCVLVILSFFEIHAFGQEQTAYQPFLGSDNTVWYYNGGHPRQTGSNTTGSMWAVQQGGQPHISDDQYYIEATEELPLGWEGKGTYSGDYSKVWYNFWNYNILASDLNLCIGDKFLVLMDKEFVVDNVYIDNKSNFRGALICFGAFRVLADSIRK